MSQDGSRSWRARFYWQQIREVMLRAARVRRPTTTSYVVCSTPRSGSGLLCDVLWRTSVAGRPIEYFRAWADGRAPEHVSREDLIRILEQAAAYSNGVLGMKIMADQLRVVVERARTIAEYQDLSAPGVMTALIPGARYVHIARRDSVRQAVSWAKAIQSGEWYEFEGGWRLPIGRTRGGNVVYDFEQIAECHRSVAQQEAAWSAFFADGKIQPYRIVYEEFVADWEKATRALLDYLEIPGRERALLWKHRRAQSDSVNAQWTKRFIEDLQQRQA